MAGGGGYIFTRLFFSSSLFLSLSFSRQNVYARRRRHRRHFLCVRMPPRQNASGPLYAFCSANASKEGLVGPWAEMLLVDICALKKDAYNHDDSAACSRHDDFF